MPIIPNKLSVKLEKAWLNIKALCELAGNRDYELMTNLTNYNPEENYPIEFGFIYNRIYYYPNLDLITIDQRSRKEFKEIALQLGFTIDKNHTYTI